MKRRTFLSVALSALVAPVSAFAQLSKGWKELGSRSVDLGLDRDVIHCGFSGSLTALCIEVRGSSVNFLDVKVVYGNGEVMDFPFRSYVKAGDRSRVIGLPGGRRIVNRVEFQYRSARGKRAEIVLWGRE